MKVTALLPMKGISERVPNKNLKDFNGLPLYSVILNTLMSSRYISEIIINTDCKLIRKDVLSKFSNKVKLIDRKKEICGNYISMNKIIESDINSVSSDIFIQTHSTNPLVKTETINKAIETMISSEKTGKYDSVFSVLKTQKRFYDKYAKPMNHDPMMLVTQHLEPIYEESSTFYIFTKKSFQKNKNRIGINPFMYELDKIESMDIDEAIDFKIAKTLHNLLR